MARTIIVPGLDGSPAPHWQDWWQKVDRRSVSVKQPDWTASDPLVWDHAIETAIRSHPGAFVVAHSLGVISIARLMACNPQLPVRGALLVAPADIEVGEGAARLGHFGPIPREPLQFPTIVVASRNDTWMEFTKAQELAASWDANLIDLGHAGHINADSGFGAWPRGMALLEKLECLEAPRNSAIFAGYAHDMGGRF